MKRAIHLFVCFLLAGTSVFAQVGINSDNSPPNMSAGLDVKFNNKGFLPPRVELTAVNSALPVIAPAAGLLVYNTVNAGSPPNNVTAGYYFWNGTRWIPVTAPQGTSIGDMQYWNGVQWVNIPVGTNGQILMLNNGIPAWGPSASLCGMSILVNHVAGTVSPVTKTTSYGTVTNIPGEPSKCWISSNLGSDHQATAATDATEASAGWYWQFNRKQGFKHDGTIRTPNTTWINSISENSDWIAANDPCNLELGTTWRIPSYTEWYNVDNAGGWTNRNATWGSGLKLHAAGYLSDTGGTLFSRGTTGVFWSGSQNEASFSWALIFGNGNSTTLVIYKTDGYSVRCVRDY
jgi:hypothetical protein